MESYPRIRHQNIVVQDIGKEVLIYDLTISKAYYLNETSALVWQLCDGNNSVTDITKAINSKFLETNVSEDFVWLALDGLKKNNLIEKSEQFEIGFTDLDRRQVIRKVGLGSMIALPLVAAVVAPSALLAQSGLGLLQPCPQLTGCAPGLACTNIIQGGALVCCVASVDSTGANAPGTNLGACLTGAVCSTSSAIRCCSGVAAFTPDSLCPALGQGSCVCAGVT